MARIGRPPRNAAERFMEKVTPCPVTGCWWWTAGVDADGYGRFRGAGETRAHRAAWVLFKGSIPPGMDVLHRCDAPGCVNWARCLFLGTNRDNIVDRHAKRRDARGKRHGRWKGGYVRPKGPGLARGERNPHAKLTEDDVRAIRARYVPGRPGGPGAQANSAAALAREFGVRKWVVQQIVSRHAWRHVGATPTRSGAISPDKAMRP